MRKKIIAIRQFAAWFFSSFFLLQGGACWAVAHASPSPRLFDYHLLLFLFLIGLLIGLLVLAWRTYLKTQKKIRKKLQSALKNQQVFRNALINSIPNPIFVIDCHGHLLDCNDRLLKTVNACCESIHNKTLIELGWLQTEEAQTLHELLISPVTQEKFHSSKHILTLSKGETIRIFLWTSPVYDDGKMLRGLIGGWIDLTEHYQLLQRLESDQEELETRKLVKKAFYATINHEVRTPMNSLIGLQELVLEKAKSGILDIASLEIAQDSAKALLALIGDILDVSNIEAGYLRLHPAPARLQFLINSAYRLFIGQAQQKKLALNLEIDASTDCWVLIDALRFKQILFNLLSNALRFTQRGSINLNARAERIDDRIQISIQVADTGTGIAEDEKVNLFHPVIRAGKWIKENNVGVGLVICRRLAEMMDGKLTLKSRAGEGTLVDLTLNVPVSEPQSAADQTSRSISQALDVLVVDDHPANRLVLEQQLKFLGHRPRVAENGARALNMWEPGKFDAVLTDCQMPIMDGYELAREIRAKEQQAGVPPCLLLGITANLHPNETQKCREAGMDGCQFKPVELDCLRSIFSSLNTRRSAIAIPSAKTVSWSFDIDAVFGAGASQTDSGRALIEQLVKTNDTDALAICNAHTAGDVQQLARLAHRTADVASLLHAAHLEQASHELELLCQDDAAIGEIDRQVEHVLSTLKTLQHELQTWLQTNDNTIPMALVQDSQINP